VQIVAGSCALGLSEAIGGRLEISETPGGGATVAIVLPAAD